MHGIVLIIENPKSDFFMNMVLWIIVLGFADILLLTFMNSVQLYWTFVIFCVIFIPFLIGTIVGFLHVMYKYRNER